MADRNPVTISDIDVPFWRRMIMIKWSIAAIPTIVLVVTWALVASIFAALVGTYMTMAAPSAP